MSAPFFSSSIFIWTCGCLGVGGLLAVAVYRSRHVLLGMMDRFVALPSLQKVVLISACTIATVCAQKAGTNDVGGVDGTNGLAGTDGELPSQMMLLPPAAPTLGGDSSISQMDIERGYRLESVSVNPDVSYVMPTDAVVVGTWHLTGAYEDVVRVGIGEEGTGNGEHGTGSVGWSFPLGNHLCDYLWAYTWGCVRPQLKNASNEIVVVGAPMSAIPDVSRFWTAATTNGTRLLTWENFVIGRTVLPLLSGAASDGSAAENSGSTVSAQLELFPSGDFIARSNDVESVYRRVNPDDWDDDGIPNDEDDEPFYCAQGESHFGPHQEIPDGDDPNHYCWVELVVRQANARVTFVGEGESWLPDPSFIAEVGATNRVIILIGKTYAVHCDMPVDIVGTSDAEIETWSEWGVTMIEWPVWFEYVSAGPVLMAAPLQAAPSQAAPLLGAGFGNGGTTISVHPPRMQGGVYDWEDDFCCYTFIADGTPVFDCKGGCGCGGGCYTGEITYECSGHLFSFGGLSCGCGGPPDDPQGHDDDDPDVPSAGPSISARFSNKAIVFEDAYTNAPGQVVGWRSTSSEVTCYAYGGTNGISYSFTIAGADDKLFRVAGARFPLTGTLAAGKSFERRITYKAIAPSTNVEEIAVTAAYTENGSGATERKVEKVTAVKVYVQAKATFPNNKVRHVFGPLEEFDVMTVPAGYGKVNQAAPLDEGGFNVSLEIDEVSFPMNLSVIHPSVDIRGVFVRDMTNADWVAAGREPIRSDVVGAGFVAHWYLQPSYVSFERIVVQEGIAPMHPKWGCFMDETCYPPSQYEHSVGGGAGTSIDIFGENRVGECDYVGVQLGVPPSSNGGYSLSIPWTWGISGGPYNHTISTLVQTVSVTSNGVTVIGKKGLSTTRGVQQ